LAWITPFLQPRHLEKEFRGGKLHLYTLVFGSNLILHGVELPEVVETIDMSPMEVVAMDVLPVDKAAKEDPQEDEEAVRHTFWTRVD
jgi:hypothetical protein